MSFNPPIKGSGTLSAGTATISNANVVASSVIIPMATNTGITNLGSLTISAQSTGSFTVKSSNILDTSTFNYAIIN